MNKSIHQRLNAHVIAAAAAVALALPSASLARTVSVAAIKDGLATAAFGDADGKAYTLAWGYGGTDGGAATNAWAHFDILGEVADGDTSRSVALPAGWGDTVTHLRFFLLEPEIPASATRVEYIEATGTQWIDTGVNLYSNDTVVAEYEYPNPIRTSNNYLFGVYKQGMTAGYFYSNGGSYPLRFQKTNGSVSANTEAGINATPGARQTVTMRLASDATSTVVSDSGETLFSGGLSGTILQDATAPLALFTANISGSPSTGYTSAAKIYSFRIYDKNNTLRQDLVPCTVNGTPAMYDRVAKGYLYNGGTGTFSTGATMATPLVVAAASATASTADYGEPDAYLDYVEATGTQYVNTGVNLCSNDTVVAEYEIPAALTKTVDLFGVHKHGMTARYVFSYSGDSGSSTIVFHRANGSNGATETKTSVTVTPGTRQTVTMKIGPGTSSIVSASGETLYFGTLTTRTVQQDATGSLAIFACNSSQNGIMAICPAKLHSFRIYAEDGSLAHHFLPCRKNDVAGLYDKATGKTLFATGGNLVAGPVLPRPAELVKWVQSDGADGSRGLYIDTGVPAKAGTGMTAELLWPVKPSASSTVCGAMADSTHHYTLYTSNGRHQVGYANVREFEIKDGTAGAVNASVRYRVSSWHTAGAQYLNVSALDGSGIDGTRTWDSSSTIDAGNSLYIFARNDAGTPNQLAKVRLYSLILTNDLGVVRDFIPCVADNGKAGLYDRFSERVFFPQASVGGTTAAFDFATEVGAATNSVGGIAEAPAARLSYVESNGTSDYVNLGIEAKDDTKIIVDMEWTVLPDDDVFCGARVALDGANKDTRFYLYNSYASSGNPPLHAMGYANGNATVSDGAGYVTTGTRYRIETTLENGSQACVVRRFVDGAWSAASTRTSSFTGPVANGIPLYLFARNLGGTADAFSAARVHSLKLWQKDGNGDYQLVRDLVPAKTTGGAIGLYDRVTAGWLFNSGERYSLTGGTESTWIDGFYLRFW